MRRGAGSTGLSISFVVVLQVGGLALMDAPRAQPVGDAARGERQFQRCFACHSVDPDETGDLQGPNLSHIVGRKAGTMAGFDYSAAMATRRADGLVWSEDALNKFLTDPQAFVPGTRMVLPGLAEPRDRADIIAYLKSAAR